MQDLLFSLILGGSGGSSSVINSLQSFPELIKKYQDLSKKPPELERYGPILDILNMHNMQVFIILLLLIISLILFLFPLSSPSPSVLLLT